MGWEIGLVKVGDQVWHLEQGKIYTVYEVFNDHGIAYCKDRYGTYTFGLRWLSVLHKGE